VHIQHGEKYLVDFPLIHGPFGNNGNLSFYPRVDNKILAGDIGHTLNHGVDIGAFEVQRGAGGKNLQGEQQAQTANPPQVRIRPTPCWQQS
jgi:hypothetical protein